MSATSELRNIAIIAHVDHGKTTLVDQLFRQSGMFRENQAVDDRLMDNMDLERERGITIAAKNCSVRYKETKINIIDTPGHADFGGEVERALSMADGAILLVDSAEGPLPQTRFVLEKSLKQRLPMVVVINKIDRPDRQIDTVRDAIYDLFIDLDASEEQLDFPLLYAIGREGMATTDPDQPTTSLEPLFQAIVTHMSAPKVKAEEPLQILISDLGYSEFLGRLAVGKVQNQTLRVKEPLVRIGAEGQPVACKPTKLQVYQGIGYAEVEEAPPGEIVILAGMEDAHIGDTLCLKSAPKALPRLQVDEPTVSMRFAQNDGPLAGKEGKIVQSSKISERLVKETLNNVSIQVERSEEKDSFLVKGRGEFQMAIIAETMRREGYELCLGRPEVIMRYEGGKKFEPIERLFVDCGEEFTGVVTEKLSRRKGRMVNMVNHGSGRARLEFEVPSRSLIGYRDEFLSDTRGTGIMNSYLKGYEEYRGDFPTRYTGSLVADRSGAAVPYALFNLEPRGFLFVTPQDPIYEGMIVGEHNRENDLDVNPCKEKKLSNMRSSGKDDTVQLAPVRPMTLEGAINFLSEDEMVEVTPKSIRLRKKYLSFALRQQKRKK